MAEITEQQVYEALGLGEQVQEPAEPAVQTPPVEPEEGAKVQEPADPAQAETTPAEGADTDPDAEDPEEPDTGTDADAPAGQNPQTPEQRRANAARRRQQERQAAIDQAVQAAVKQEQDKQADQMKDFFARAGLKNTFTGAPITSMEEFNAWNQEFEQSRLQRDLKAGKLTPESLATAIGNHPAVKQAQQLIDQNAAARKAQQEAAAKARIDAEIAEIHKIDASITTLEDLSKAAYWPELYAMTRKGYSIRDAHFLLNHERLEKAKLEAARQQSLNNARGKDHMTGAATPRGGGSVSVPAAELAIFRQFNPDATDAQIQAYYNQYKKR